METPDVKENGKEIPTLAEPPILPVKKKRGRKPGQKKKSTLSSIVIENREVTIDFC